MTELRDKSNNEFDIIDTEHSSESDRITIDALKAEVNRLNAENRRQLTLLEEQQTLKYLIEASKKKISEMIFIDDRRHEDLNALQAEKQKIFEQLELARDEIQSLDSTIKQFQGQTIEFEKLQIETCALATRNEVLTAKIEVQTRELEEQTAGSMQLSEDYKKLSAAHHALSEDYSKLIDVKSALQNLSTNYELEKNKRAEALNELINANSENKQLKSQLVDIQELRDKERIIADQRQDRETELRIELNDLSTEHAETIDKMLRSHSNYVSELKSLFSHQRSETHLRFQELMQQRVQYLDSSKSVVAQLTDYRKTIERDYPAQSLRNPGLLGESPSSLDIYDTGAEQKIT